MLAAWKVKTFLSKVGDGTLNCVLKQSGTSPTATEASQAEPGAEGKSSDSERKQSCTEEVSAALLKAKQFALTVRKA
jgi:hypothetical protein